jgi:glycosyltransferase involved in cell wall biosynthesis
MWRDRIFAFSMAKYSIIVAVYNRPDELNELLVSLAGQTYRDFEVVIVEDGSTISSKDVCAAMSVQLDVKYFSKDNSGPGPSRNYGCRRATGDYFMFIDSDCTVPPHYMATIDQAVVEHGYDAFGGPDREDASFTPTQKAISFAMTSFLTTGGIRGGKRRVGGSFHPRSFNMGISREVFNETDGFARMRFGEDVEFSIRMIEHGYKVGLIPDAWVYHKRRTDLWKFFKQVHNSGIARINITLRHPNTLKPTHFFPAMFTAYTLLAIGTAIVEPMGWVGLAPLAVYLFALMISALVQYKSPMLALKCVAASLVQLTSYGLGFMRGIIWRIILNKPEQGAFEASFYK